LDLNLEKDFAEFLGISIKEQLPLGAIKLTQQGLIKPVHLVLDLSYGHSKKAPVEYGSPLAAEDGELCLFTSNVDVPFI